MKEVTKAAKLASLRSQKCCICPIRLRCDPATQRICHDAFVEGFKKGAKAAEKAKEQEIKRKLFRLITDDTQAAAFQTMGQYRSWIINKLA